MKPASIQKFLKNRSWFFLFLVFSLNCSQVFALNSLERLTQQNYRALSGRIWTILKYRFEGLAECSRKEKDSLRQRFDDLYFYSNRENDVITVLDLYKDSLQTEKSCRQSLDAAEMKFHNKEREKFSVLHLALNTMCGTNQSLIDPLNDSNCVAGLAEIVRELDPHCMEVQVPNPKQYYDGFPCISGDNMIGKFLFENSANVGEEVTLFIKSLRSSLGSAEKREKGIELYKEFLGERPDSRFERKKFLAVLALMTSSTSSNGSYIEGYHDKSWRLTLEKTGSSQQALAVFNQIRLAVDEFRTLKEWSVQNKAKLKLAAQTMLYINRHDIISAFLACYYRDKKPALQKLIPKALGYSYESFDFVSHLNEGDTLKEAGANFFRDTRRYREGAAWGSAFCRQ